MSTATPSQKAAARQLTAPAPTPDAPAQALSPQQTLFVAAYTSNGHNAAEAARTAGYHPEYGRKCKELPYVKAAIERTLEGMTLGMAAWLQGTAPASHPTPSSIANPSTDLLRPHFTSEPQETRG